MQFIYRYAHLPAKRKELVIEANAAAARVHDRLISAGVPGPQMDEYYRARFYKRDLQNLVGKLRNCTYHVVWAVADSHKAVNDVSLVDHGGGLGLIGLLAKEMGVGRVIYNDIDPKFVQAAQGIARMAGAEADQYIVGDVDCLVETLGDDEIDVLVSYDVLEHIYDLDEFFATLCSARCCPRVLCMSSGANMFNPRYLHHVIPIQRGRELLNCCKRIAIIRDCISDLTEEELVLLCRKTRLLVRSEIQSVTKRYLDDKKMVLPQKMGANAYDPFRSNTVDPETGWWAEHLLNPFYLAEQLRKYGFTAMIRPGPQDGRSAILNPLIRIAGATVSLFFAGFYTVSAVRAHSIQH